MVVQEDGRQCRGVDAEFGLRRYVASEHGVEGVYAFEDEDGVVLQAQERAALLALAGEEIVAGQFYLLALNQGIHLRVEQRDVHGLDVFEVVLAAFVNRCFLAVHEVVVQRYGHGAFARCHELHRQALGEGCLAARRWSGDEDDLDFGPCGNLVGQTGEALLLQRLGDVDQFVSVSLSAGFVKLSDGRYPQDVLPAVLLAEDVEHFRLVRQGLQAVGLLRVGQPQEQAVLVGQQVEVEYLSGIRQQRAVEVVGCIVQRVVGGVEGATVLQQLCLIFQSVAAEQGHRLFRGTGVVVEGDAGIDDFLHAAAQGAHHVGRHRLSALHLQIAEVTA